MLNNKRGLSTIIVTVLIIGLSIVAIGVVWVVINNTLKRGSESIDLGSVCMEIQVTATSAKCASDSSCAGVLEREGQGTEAIGGVKLVFVNSSGSRSGAPADIPGNIELLGSKTFNITAVESLVGNPNKIESTVYFIDSSGKTKYCSQASVFEF